MQSPTLLANQFTRFPEFCDKGKIGVANIARANKLMTSQSPPDEQHSLDILDIIKQYIKSAIGYYLLTHQQYTLDNLHLFEPTKLITEAKRARKKPTEQKISAINIQKKLEIKHQNINDILASRKSSKSPMMRSKTPNTNKSNKTFYKSPESNRSSTPIIQTRSELSQSKNEIKALNPLNVKSTSSLIQKNRRSKSKEENTRQGKFSRQNSHQGNHFTQSNREYANTRYDHSNDSKKTPTKKFGVLNRSYDDAKFSNTVKDKKLSVENRLNKTMKPKTKSFSQKPAISSKKVYMLLANKFNNEKRSENFEFMPEEEIIAEESEILEQKSPSFSVAVEEVTVDEKQKTCDLRSPQTSIPLAEVIKICNFP